MKKKNKNYKEPKFNDVLKFTDEDEFEIGQGYERMPAKKLRCKKCNSDKFKVGQGDYFTAIKCVNCGWEICIHEG